MHRFFHRDELTVAGAVLTTAYADSGSIRFNVIKAGFIVGGSGGSGTSVFHGRRYPRFRSAG